ncbi:hypothetical protein ES332_A05G334000v1 [Gossypium tomentosum]|uniref:Uncharacterized protein n=1 Tax=Gossypium tomentosum TaxID=34277 RepID=A0A5D2QQQ7_GOSTO|nr:hypothetical protein ES332_A05G334000v1 [Gossypium tomentosum]
MALSSGSITWFYAQADLRNKSIRIILRHMTLPLRFSILGVNSHIEFIITVNLS